MLEQGESNARRNELSGTVAGSAVQAGSIHGDVRFDIASQPSIPSPAQLPAAAFCVGRDKELAHVQQLATGEAEAGRPTLVVITGAGGVGKTRLGLYWLHQIREEYKDGQLFADLRGFSGDPAPSAAPLEGFLRALEIDTAKIPENPDEQAALFRTVTTGRRLIIMLDNVTSAAQVRPLLPGPGPALVVVTTRQRLPGLAMEGARFVDLAPLDESGALEVLSHMVGRDRIQAEQDKARTLVSLCGGLPLAVCASGARLAARSRWTIARVLAELTDETLRLAALSMENDVSIKAVFDLSYRNLPAEAARLYRLLGLHPEPYFDSAVAAAMAGITRVESARLLGILVDANLIEEESDDRFRFHELFRLHAKFMENESEAARRMAVSQLENHPSVLGNTSSVTPTLPTAGQ